MGWMIKLRMALSSLPRYRTRRQLISHHYEQRQCRPSNLMASGHRSSDDANLYTTIGLFDFFHSSSLCRKSAYSLLEQRVRPCGITYGKETDATKGYIGDTILSRLIEHKDSKNFDITILLRPTRSPAGYEALGLKTLSGSDADLSLLRAQAAAADVVFATVCSALTLATLENQRAHRQTVTTFRQPRRFFRALRIATRRQGRPHPHPHRKLSLLNTLTILNSRIVWHRRTYQQRSRAA